MRESYYLDHQSRVGKVFQRNEYSVVNDGIREIILTSGGSGYSSAPTVTISVPDNESIDHSLINKDDDWAYIVIVEDS